MAVDMARDDRGAEIRVETGTGRIEKLDRRERNIGVTIRSDNSALRKPVTGWLDSMSLGEGAHPQLVEGLHVRYRINVRRKDHVDPAIPLSELEGSDKVRDLVVISPIDAPHDSASPEGQAQLQENLTNPKVDEGHRHQEAPRPDEPPPDPPAPTDDLSAAQFLELAATAADAGAGRLDPDDPRAGRARKGAEVFRSLAAELTGGGS